MRTALNEIYDYYYHAVIIDTEPEIFANKLLKSFEDNNRDSDERDSILHSDIDHLLTLLVESENEDNEDNEHIDWLETLICQHLENVADLGIVLNDEYIKNLPASIKQRIKGSRIEYYYDKKTALFDTSKQAIIEKAKEKNIISEEEGKYIWYGTRADLAYFVNKLFASKYSASDLRKIENNFLIDKEGKRKNVIRLDSAINNVLSSHKDRSVIDSLFQRTQITEPVTL